MTKSESILISLPNYYTAMFAPLDVQKLPNKYIEALPDAYLKTPESVNNRLLNLSELAMKIFHKEILEVEDMVNLDCVTGETMNLYGQMLDQPRGKLIDRQYRAVIRAQIACNLSKGDFTSVLAAIRMMLACDKSQVRLTELENENCAVKVDMIPYEILVKTGLTTRQIMALIKRLVPAGVRIEELLFEGTFEFGTDDMEYDEKRGFADIARIIGGYFGAVVGDDENAESLPISF